MMTGDPIDEAATQRNRDNPAAPLTGGNSQRLHQLLNDAPVMMWTTAADHSGDFFNDKWLEFTGRPLDLELRDGWHHGVHPEDADRCRQTFATHAGRRQAFETECRLKRNDGAYRSIVSRWGVRHDADGTFAGYIGTGIDVTEQRAEQAAANNARRSAEDEKALLESVAAQQQSILRNSPVGILVVRDHLIVWTNLTEPSLLGYAGDELCGMPVRELFEKQTDYGQFATAGLEALKRSGTYCTEVRLCRKSGAAFWCQLNGRAVDRCKPEDGAVWTLNDVDDRHRTEAEFRLQSAMLSHMAEGVVLVSERDGTIVHTNEMFERMLGYGAGELRGRPVSVLNSPGELTREEIAARIFGELHEHGQWKGEIANQRKDGTVVLCQASVSRFEHPELGAVWLSVHTDITRAKEMETALRDAKERYDDLVRHLPSGVQLIRLHRDGTYGFDFVSPRTAQLVGVGQEELYRDATTWLRHAWPEDAAKAVDEARRCIASHLPYRWEGRFGMAESTRWLRFEGEPVVRPDGEVLYHATVNDITERKALELALHEAQKLTAIGHLAGGMAHEFNNILAAMLLNIGLAQTDDSASGIADVLGELKKSCDRAAGMIKQLLAFSQKSNLNPSRIDLIEFLAPWAGNLQKEVGDGVRIELAGSAKAGSVIADGNLLEQALRNLCINAADAMNRSGTIRIGLQSVELEAGASCSHPESRPGRYVCISVADDGRGVDPSIRERLFEPFFTTKEVGQGAGLGLATVLGIVRQHQGWMEVESQPGVGSCFRILLPSAEAVVSPPGTGTGSELTAGTTGTILLVEDDAILRKAVSHLLRQAGFQVFAAPDAGVAQTLWEAHGKEIDLLLSDVVMPGSESGLQLAERLLQQTPALKVILTSGYNVSITKHITERGHRIVYLPKPVPSETLLQTIRQSLASSR